MTISLTEPVGLRQGLTDGDLRVGTGSTATGRTPMLSGILDGSHEMRFLSAAGELVLVVDPDPPNWLVPTAQGIVDLLDLSPNWDSYGGRPINPDFAVAALSLAFEVLRDDSPTPSVVPTSSGGIQLEWHQNSIDLEIELISPTKFIGFFKNRTTEATWEQDVSFDLRPLIDAVAALSR